MTNDTLEDMLASYLDNTVALHPEQKFGMAHYLDNVKLLKIQVNGSNYQYS
jgi:hypothetical protein